MLTVGRQLTEAIREHTDATKKEADARAVELLATVGIPDPEQRVKNYPHEMSGGMRPAGDDRHGPVLQVPRSSSPTSPPPPST